MANNCTDFSPQPVSTCADFTNVPLDTVKTVKEKQPRRILHFSDGVLEEYSTDEEEDNPPPPPAVDTKSLTWGPWFWYQFLNVGGRTLYAADFCGEKLAWFFGITTPKYQSAIDEFYRLKAEEDREEASEARLKEEMLGLSSVDVNVEGKPRDKGSGDADIQKF